MCKKRMPSSLLLITYGLLITPSLFGAESIYAWGYGDILQSTLTAVKFTFAHNDYQGLFKFALLIALTMATIATARFGLKGDLYSLPKIFLMSMGVSGLFISSTINTVVYDVNTKQSNVIDNVPWAVGKPLIWFTGMEKHLGELLETTFAVPSDISYSNGGFLTPFALMNGVGQAKIIDPYLFQSVDNFLIDCVMPDIATGYINPQVLSQSEDLWLEFSNTNPARITMYYDQSNTHGTVMACTDAYGTLGATLSAYANGTGMQSLGKMLGGYSAAQLSSALGTTSNFLMGYSQSSSSLLMQSILLNQFSDTYSNWAAMNGMDTASVAYGTGKGQQTAEANMVISGALGSKYIPIIKGVLTVIIVALTPIVALLLLTPLFGKVLTGYLMTMVWLSLWHIGEVILNFITLTKANSYITGVSSSNGIYTMVTKPVVDASTMDYVNMASSMYWMIPTIAALIVGGFSYMAFQSMTGGMTARVARGEMAATEVGSGSASIGNISHGNYSANKTDSVSSMLGGKHYGMSNDFDQKLGSAMSNMNSFNESSHRVNGRRMQGGFNGVSSDGYETFAQGFNGTDGSQTVKGDRGAMLDQSGNFYNGDFTTQDLKSGSMKTEHWENGVRKSFTQTLKGGYEISQVERDGETFTTIGSKDGNITFDSKDNVIAQSGNAVSISKGASKAIEQSKGESTKNTFNSTIEAMKNGQVVDSKGVELIAAAQYAAMSANSHVDANTRQKAINDTVSDLVSVSEQHSKGGGKSWDKINSAQKVNGTTLSDGVTLSADVKSDSTLIGKLASAVFGASVGASASVGIQNAHLDQNGVTFSYKDGRTESYSLTTDARNDHMRSVANSVANSSTTSHTTGDTRTDTHGATGKSGHQASTTTGKAYKQGEGYGEELVNNYVEKLSENVNVQDSKALHNQILTGWINDKSRGYEGGREALVQDFLMNKPELVSEFEQYARSHVGMTTTSPAHVLSTDRQNELSGSAERIVSDVNQNTKNANSAFNEANIIGAPSFTTANAQLGQYSNLLPTASGMVPSIEAKADTTRDAFLDKQQGEQFKYQHLNFSKDIEGLSSAVGGMGNIMNAGASPTQKIGEGLDDLIEKVKK